MTTLTIIEGESIFQTTGLTWVLTTSHGRCKGCLFIPCTSFTMTSTCSKHKTTVSKIFYLLELEIIPCKLAVNKRNYIMKFTYQWENNELLHQALSPTSGSVENQTASRTLDLGEPQELEKETEAVTKLHRLWKKSFIGNETRVAGKTTLHIAEKEPAIKTTYRRMEAA